MRTLPLLAFVLLLSFLSFLSVPAASAAPATSGQYAAQVLASTNAERTTRDLTSLDVYACLRKAAQKQARRIAAQGELSHSPDFDSFGSRCKLSSWGENVAQAPGGDRGRGVVRQWMASSGHRANILEPAYRQIGVAAVRKDGAWWVVQVFGRRT